MTGNIEKPRVSAVILHLDDTASLLECLASLRQVNYPAFDITVVHNGLPDAELEKNLSPFSGMLSGVMHTGGNLGFSLGNNLGIKRALEKGADYVLLLNDDIVVNPDFLDIIVEEAEKNPMTGMIGPEVLHFSDRARISFRGAKLDRESGSFFFPHADEISSPELTVEPVESDYVNGCALLVRKSLIDHIGLLDERFFIYWEESDWGLRAKRAGFRCLVVPRAKIWHKVSVTTGGNNSPFKIYHKTRSHLFFAGRHCPGLTGRLIYEDLRDCAWLIYKSGQRGRIRKAAAYLAGIAGYLAGSSGVGPAWLRDVRRNV